MLPGQVLLTPAALMSTLPHQIRLIGGQWKRTRLGVPGVPGVPRDTGDTCVPLDVRGLFMLAVATSIDALAVGITLAFLQVDIVFAASFIGCVTFALVFAGVVVGHQFGSRWERPSTIAGGVALILIGRRSCWSTLAFSSCSVVPRAVALGQPFHAEADAPRFVAVYVQDAAIGRKALVC